MIARLRTYGRFVKIEHSIFALPMVFAGALLAWDAWPIPPAAYPFLARLMGWVLLAACGARTVGFAFNRLIDRNIDALNPRTQSRELPSHAMSSMEAYAVLLVGAGVYVGSAFFISPICVALSPLPIVIFLLYPFMKRFTALAHFGVGTSLALGPLAAGIAVKSAMYMNRADFFGATHELSVYTRIGTVLRLFLQDTSLKPILTLSLFTFFWVSGFDIIYATLDEDFDRAQGLHSLPAKFGRRQALNISAALHGLAFVTLGLLYVSYLRAPVAGVVFGATGVLLFLEQHKAEDVNLAFFKINGIISFLVLGLVCAGMARV